jgi:hypothetical protein
MKRAGLLAAILVLLMAGFCSAEEKKLLIDDFEISVSSGPEARLISARAMVLP